jgi:hypothetical protein
MGGSMPLRRLAIADLDIEDEASFAHVALYGDLKDVVRRAGLVFLAPERGESSWDRAAFLNLTYWSPGVADVLSSSVIPADVVAHVAWHHLADRFVATSVEAHLLGESIASAFDFYLVGRLLGRSPDAAFLESQVPRMAEVWDVSGGSPEGFEQLLAEVAEDPERAFEDLRQLLFDTSLALSKAEGAEQADRALAASEAHRFAGVLHHYELSTWVLRTKLDRALGTRGDEGAGARAVDAALRAAPDAVAWLETSWVTPALAGDAPTAAGGK